MAASSPMASEPATLDSISLVDMDSSTGEDYLLTDLPSDEPTLDDVDMNVTKADLDA